MEQDTLGINFSEKPSRVEGAWRSGYFGIKGSHRIWRGWISEVAGRHAVIVFEKPQANEIMAWVYGPGVTWGYDEDEDAFYASRSDEETWLEVWRQMTIIGPDDYPINCYLLGYNTWYWEERKVENGAVTKLTRTLPMPDPRFSVTFRPNAVIAVDSDGEVAYMRIKNGPEWTHRGWAHLQFWFDKLPWTAEEMKNTEAK